MDGWLLGLCAGLLGGAGGALAVHYLLPARGAEAEASLTEHSARPVVTAYEPQKGPVLEGRSEDPLAARLERIERLLAARAEGSAAAADPAAIAVLRKAVGEELDQRLAALKAEAAGGKNAKPAEPKKKRATLSEAARELELTREEESDLRRIYADSQEKYLKILAGPDGDVEPIRREVEEAKTDPRKRNLVMAKYMAKALPRLGEFMQVGLEQEMAVQAAVGPDKAARIESGFDLVEANPLGTGSEVRVEASAR